MSSKDELWKEAKRRCRLSEEDIEMAKALGFQPKVLIQNIPAPTQRWKAPVRNWIRDLYQEKFGRTKSTRAPSSASAPPSYKVGAPDPVHPWPDKPEIPELTPIDWSEFNEDGWVHDMEMVPVDVRPSPEEEADDNSIRLRQQRSFRWAAQAIARAMSELPGVSRVLAFGTVAQPLRKEPVEGGRFQRYGIELLHQCGGLDLAVWMSDFRGLKDLQGALKRALKLLHASHGNVANHQVNIHLFDAATAQYRGRLCHFKECPKPGKRECDVPDCGAELLLRQLDDYNFRPAQFDAEPKVILFDRTTGFVVKLPRMSEKRSVTPPDSGEFGDVPF